MLNDTGTETSPLEKKLSKESMEEQSAAGLLELTREERSEIKSLNSSYSLVSPL